MKIIVLILLALTTGFLSANLPNILWIVSEDNSSHWIGCYGIEQAKTPRIDTLAGQGFLFENAYSNAPVCAVARATILNGAYSPTMGTQHMRSRHPIPGKYRPYVEYLRKSGYYCTNNSKTDYNFKGNDLAMWDDSSKKAHYRNRPEGEPFFAIFNLKTTHESSLFSDKPAEPERVKPEEIDLPPYLPDLPEIRKDFARYHDRITQMDSEVGKLLDDLEEAGLSDNTIVIYTSDHGGILPRGKRYLEDTGVKIPMIVRVPEKFLNLSPFKVGQRVKEPVSFVDFSPTFLSLAGIRTPAQMQGRALLGSERVEPAEDEMEFLYADRFDELYGMRRGLTDGKWKYIRNFNPHLPQAPYSFYQFGQPGWTAYRKAFEEGKLTGIHETLWKAPASSEQLFDLSADPWEIRNLATDPGHVEKLVELRQRLKDTMADTIDTGLIPEPLFEALGKGKPIADFASNGAFNLEKILQLAFTATAMDAKNLPRLRSAIQSQDVLERYWGVLGMLNLKEKAQTEMSSLGPLREDEYPLIRTTAAETLFLLGGEEEATKILVAQAETKMDPSSFLNVLNTLHRLNLIDQLPVNWEKQKWLRGNTYEYVHRFAEKPTD